jgi:hypothetical protein
MQNKLGKILIFCAILEVNDGKSRIRIRKSSVRIQGAETVPKCHGSGIHTALKVCHVIVLCCSTTTCSGRSWMG